MSPSTFVRKYPDATRNENCLRDIACPYCGNRESFEIEAKSAFVMFDSGADEFGDVEHDSSARTACRACGKVGYLRQFTIKRLDELLPLP